MKELETAIRLRAEGCLKESNTIFMDLVNQYPDDPVVNYQCAWSYDVLGLEKEAIPYYEKAMELGLPEEDLRGALLGFGSTYRTLGEYEKSRQVFLKGIELFPEDHGIKTFYAMTLYNLGKHSHAMKILLNTLAVTSADETITQYAKAITFYAEDLDKIW